MTVYVGACCNFARECGIAQAPHAGNRAPRSQQRLRRDQLDELLQQSGPPFPDAEARYPGLLRATGRQMLNCIDVAAEFARCMDVMLDAFDEHRQPLLGLLGEEDYADRVTRRQSTRTAVSRGILKREIFLVT